MRLLIIMTHQSGTILSQRNEVNKATRGAINNALQNGGNSASGISPGVVNLYNKVIIAC